MQYQPGPPPDPSPPFLILGHSILEIIAILGFLGVCVGGYWKYVHPIVRKYWNRLRTPIEGDEFRHLLRFVQTNGVNTWNVAKNPAGRSVIILDGKLRATNVSSTVKVIICRSYVYKHESSMGFHMLPGPNDFWGSDFPIEKKSSSELKFNYVFVTRKKRFKFNLKFDLVFIDQFGNVYIAKGIQFLKLVKTKE